MINYNGEIQQTSPALSAKNRGFLYGDGVFELVKYVEGTIFFWEEHYLRLMATMRIARMEIPSNFTLEFLEAEIIKTIQANSLASKALWVRITITRKGGISLTPEENEIDYCIDIEGITNLFYQNLKIPYEVELFKDYYTQADLLGTLNITGRMLQIVGSVFARENDYQNCILLNTHKNAVSFLDGNLFLVQGEQILTPPLSEGAPNGITRKKLIEAIQKTSDFSLEERPISPFELQKADELFLTNTKQGIQSVSKYRKKEYNNIVATNLLGKLNTLTRLG
ncbi:aminotransferase class IV [uncultured Capnocytophaga sp.]|jgi:branched-chain-amino-acid aminotransferase|uniref:aminotransferase class IV n=1 Tax=uncultured Capnocytophaga sp. TaxID=159273 RepID=UPI00262B0977|nr:aminotransferase class IV [uncultured Capnocytophaga sp.]